MARQTIKKAHKMGGEHHLHFFENGYGASVVRFEYSYGFDKGLWELAVIKGHDEDNYTLTYDTPITDDVIGHLNKKKINELLNQIEALPKEKP